MELVDGARMDGISMRTRRWGPMMRCVSRGMKSGAAENLTAHPGKVLMRRQRFAGRKDAADDFE